MKFGKKWRSLVHEPWMKIYVNYNDLKKVLKREPPPEGHFKFKSMLTQALQVCDDFFAVTVTPTFSGVKPCNHTFCTTRRNVSW